MIQQNLGPKCESMKEIRDNEKPAVEIAFVERSSSATIKALVGLQRFDHGRAWTRYCNAVMRGAAIGFCLRGGLHLLKIIFSLISARRRVKRPQPISEVLQDTLRYTGFLGAFAGVFVSVDEGLAAMFGAER